MVEVLQPNALAIAKIVQRLRQVGAVEDIEHFYANCAWTRSL